MMFWRGFCLPASGEVTEQDHFNDLGNTSSNDSLDEDERGWVSNNNDINDDHTTSGNNNNSSEQSSPTGISNEKEELDNDCLISSSDAKREQKLIIDGINNNEKRQILPKQQTKTVEDDTTGIANQNDHESISLKGNSNKIKSYTTIPSPSATSSSTVVVTDEHTKGSSNGNTGNSSVNFDANVDQNNNKESTKPSSSSSSLSSTLIEHDEYSDVRERMEYLVRLDREKHLNDNGDSYYYDHENNNSNNKKGNHRAGGGSSTTGTTNNTNVDVIPFFAALTTYLGYSVLILIGHIRDSCAYFFGTGRYLHPNKQKYKRKTVKNNNVKQNVQINDKEKTDLSSYAPLLKSWENFYTRRLYHRIQDCFNRPIASKPSSIIYMLERVSIDGNKTMHVLGNGLDSSATTTINNTTNEGECTNDNNTTSGSSSKNSNNNTQHLRKKYVNGVHTKYVPEFDPLHIDDETSAKSILPSSTSAEVVSSTIVDPSHCSYDDEDYDNDRVARECLNLGSYNYLGFSDDWNITCERDVIGSLNNYQISCSSSRNEYGTTQLHKRLEGIVAKFLNKDDSIIYNMGFNTNATTIPTLIYSKEDLILSDELNHTSIVNGARASGVITRTFRHNDSLHLEQLIRDSIITGHPRTRRPWNKIIILVEGIYSMEGEYCNLRAISAVCNKYQCYLYLDEAHSIGAMGITGRGCCEYTGVDPSNVHVMMGTFTKSFGGMGGYIAADQHVIDYLRTNCAGSIIHNSLSPVVCQQVISSFEVIMGRDKTNIGQTKLHKLRDNSNYFRMRLIDMGLHVLGNYDSPILPVMLYNPTKIAAFSRECLKRGLAVVVVGFPAVPILMSRARFCISSGHTREQLDIALEHINEVADILQLRYCWSTFG